MTRARNLLHPSKFKSFLSYALETGWKAEPVKGPYEVSRLRKAATVAIVHRRDKGDHYTTWGPSLDLAHEWLRYKKSRGGK